MVLHNMSRYDSHLFKSGLVLQKFWKVKFSLKPKQEEIIVDIFMVASDFPFFKVYDHSFRHSGEKTKKQFQFELFKEPFVIDGSL